MMQRWQRNFGRGMYLLIVLMVIGIVLQVVMFVVGSIAIACFPVLEESNPIGFIFSGVAFLLAGVPLIGALFTHFYERELDDPVPEAK